MNTTHTSTTGTCTCEVCSAANFLATCDPATRTRIMRTADDILKAREIETERKGREGLDW